MQTIAEVAAFLEAHANLHALLLHVESLQLPDSWIGAGFVRNAVWDALHGRTVDTSHLNDIDVIFFDPRQLEKERETDIERQLRQLAPDVPWSVKNQARMHLRNEDIPYRDTADAIAHWPETATAIAARTVHGKVEIMAPYGVEDLLNLIVKPTPAFRRKMQVYHTRQAKKNWSAHWPQLTIIADSDEAKPTS